MIDNDIKSAAEPAVDQATDKRPEDIAEERNIVFEEVVESILFAAGHPISYATLARVLNMTPAKVRDRVFEYSLKYNSSDIPRGVILLTYNESCQLCTKKFYLPEIRDALGIKKSGTLSTSSLEALAIVAYNQPVTRVFVDTLRRADSSYAMNNLIDRGLIECKGRLDVPGRPMLYGTTTDFLRSFGLKDISELPTTTDDMNAMFAKGKNVEDNAELTEDELKEKENQDGVSGQIELQITTVESQDESRAEHIVNDSENAPDTPIAIEEFDETSAEDDIIND